MNISMEQTYTVFHNFDYGIWSLLGKNWDKVGGNTDNRIIFIKLYT